jgi:hypothetical protein
MMPRTSCRSRSRSEIIFIRIKSSAVQTLTATPATSTVTARPIASCSRKGDPDRGSPQNNVGEAANQHVRNRAPAENPREIGKRRLLTVHIRRERRERSRCKIWTPAVSIGRVREAAGRRSYSQAAADNASAGAG